MQKKLSFMLMALLPSVMLAESVTVTVSNPGKEQCCQIVELPLKDVYSRMGIDENRSIAVRNAEGQNLDYQKTYDGKLIFDASARPGQSVKYTIVESDPYPMKTWVKGAMYPLRKDDIAWENDRGAYRVYGPALQRTGERSYGIDIWTKNTPDLVVTDRYIKDYMGNVTGDEYHRSGNKKAERETDLVTSFHYDHGDGLDCYAVGPTLGCGTPALMKDGKLLLPYCYKKYTILDNGPLRFTVELTYNPVDIDGSKVTEHRIISLDKGSNFNKMEVWYEGLSKPMDLAAGVVVHTADTESVVLGKNYVQYADPTDVESHGYQLYVACLFPNGAKTKFLAQNDEKGIAGHAIGIVKDLKDGQHYTYYFGSAWSKYDVRTQSEWQLRVNEFLNDHLDISF